MLTTIIAAIIRAVNCMSVPNFSDIPTCRIFAVAVIVFDVWPVGIVSRTETGRRKSALRYSNLILAD